jgi:hypothetical protein
MENQKALNFVLFFLFRTWKYNQTWQSLIFCQLSKNRWSD